MNRHRVLPVAALLLACHSGPRPDDPKVQRLNMVKQIEARGVHDQRVLGAMYRVPRDAFVPPKHHDEAYEDHPIPIGWDQTISQPYIVALMTELAAIKKTDRVLEIGTGSGYQAAILAELAKEVYTIEIVPDLARTATAILYNLGYDRVRVRHGDGYKGWPEAAPFDAILVTAAAPAPPPALLRQLVVGGRLVIPVGDDPQELQVHRRTERGFDVQHVIPVRFVPMTGEVRDTPP